MAGGGAERARLEEVFLALTEETVAAGADAD
jgi:hypothetical protein